MSEEIKEILYYFEKYHFEDTMIDGKETKLLYDYIIDLQIQLQQKENIIKEVKDYIRSKSIKFTMAYVEDDGRIDLLRSDYRIDKLTSKQVKELLEMLDKER